MAEEVNTGGLVRFVRKKDYEEELDEEASYRIEEAYKKAEIRKARERRNKIIWISVGVLVLLAIIGYFILR